MSAPPLFAHQRAAVDFALTRGGCAALFHEPGCGKSRTSLEIFLALRNTSPGLRLLVVAPKSILRAAWGEDVARFTDLTFSTYDDLKRQVLPDVLAINYEKLISARHLAAITALLEGPWMVVVDESSRMKNPRSVTTKTLLKLAARIRYRMVLSGTPAPNSLEELWGQLRFVDPNIMPSSFFAYRNSWFVLSRGSQTMPHPTGRVDRATMHALFQHGWTYTITPAKRAALLAHIAPVCHWVKKAEALDLPPQIDQVREVTLSANERTAYREMEDHLVIEVGQDIITASVALARLVKLRSITSGFAYTTEGKTCHIGTSKLAELADVLEELGPIQVIIWIQFKAEAAMITSLLEAQRKTFATLYSDTADHEASIRQFQRGEAQYLIAHPKSAGHGMTFVNCSTGIYFSVDFSWENYTQSRDRIHRIGQVSHCLYLHLVCRDTIDEDILAVLKKKRSLQEVVNRYFKRSQGAVLVKG